MSKSFLKFKRRVRLQSVFASILWGLGVGLASLAALLLVFKLTGSSLPPYYYAVCAGGAAVVSAILYFIFMPSDKRLAKRLDSLYSLDEKVSTMLEFKDVEGGFAQLQREDADMRLADKPKKALKSKQLVAGILAFTISVASFAGALVIPAKAEAGEAPIDEFDKQWIITAINELITTVENSYVADGLKATTISELRSLLSFVEGSDLLSQMKSEAIKTVININSALRMANSAESIGDKLSGSSNEQLAALGKELKELSASKAKKALETVGDAIADSTAEDASFTADEMNAYLQSSGVRSDDSVYLLFKTLIASVKEDHEDADKEFKSMGAALSSALLVQSVNRTTMNLVINRLCNLFGITESDLTAADPEADIELDGEHKNDDMTDDSEVEEPDVNMGSGGLGTGDVIYGSNDLVFDPYTNTYRPYGEIINEYFAKANEQITDGKTSEDISDAAQEYFNKLFGGSD